MDLFTIWAALFIVLGVQKIMGKAEDCYLWNYAMTTLVASLVCSLILSLLFLSKSLGLAIAGVVISGGLLLLSFVFTLRSLYSISHNEADGKLAEEIEAFKKEQDAIVPIYLDEDYQPAINAIPGEREALEASLILTKFERSQLETMYYKFDNSFLTQKWLNRNNLGIAERGILVHEYFKRGLVSPELNEDYKVFVALKEKYPGFEVVINQALNSSQKDQGHARKLAKRFDDKSLKSILPKSFERNDALLFSYYLAEAFERELFECIDKTVNLAQSLKLAEERRLAERLKLEEERKMAEELKKVTGSTLLYNDKAEQDWQAKDKAHYEALQKSYPNYSQQIDDSLKLDDFARFKLEDSYQKLSLEELKDKFQRGAEAIRKGAYGVVLLYLHERGELKG